MRTQKAPGAWEAHGLHCELLRPGAGGLWAASQEDHANGATIRFGNGSFSGHVTNHISRPKKPRFGGSRPNRGRSRISMDGADALRELEVNGRQGSIR